MVKLQITSVGSEVSLHQTLEQGRLGSHQARYPALPETLSTPSQKLCQSEFIRGKAFPTIGEQDELNKIKLIWFWGGSQSTLKWEKAELKG